MQAWGRPQADSSQVALQPHGSTHLAARLRSASSRSRASRCSLRALLEASSRLRSSRSSSSRRLRSLARFSCRAAAVHQALRPCPFSLHCKGAPLSGGSAVG